MLTSVETKGETTSSSVFQIDSEHIVEDVFFGDGPESSHLLSFVSDSTISIGVFNLNTLDKTEISFSPKCTADNGADIIDLCYSRCTAEDARLITAGMDDKVRLITLCPDGSVAVDVIDLPDFNTSCVSTQPWNRDIFAAVGSTKSCVFKDTSGNTIAKVPLGDFGVSVRFNPKETDKFMVAEQCGKVALFDIRTMRSISSFYSSGAILDAHWSTQSPSVFAVCGYRSVEVWNLEISSTPELVSSSGGCSNRIRFSSFDPDLLAVLYRARSEVQAFHLNWPSGSVEVKPVFHSSKVNGMSWHHWSPICATASRKSISFLAVEV